MLYIIIAKESCNATKLFRYDNLTILNQNDEIVAGPYCNRNRPQTYSSSGNYAKLKFTSDSSVTFAGFDISYTCNDRISTTEKPISGCGSTELSGPSGTIKSPGWPNEYPNNSNCLWKINCPQGQVVRIDIISFDIESDGDCRSVYFRLRIANCSF